MPTGRLDALLHRLRPVPLKPFLPTYQGEEFFVGPGPIATVSRDEHTATAAFGAWHRAILTPLLEHDFRWCRFEG